jgi:hypothetical protein
MTEVMALDAAPESHDEPQVISCRTLLSPEPYTDMRSTREHLHKLKNVHLGNAASGRTMQD